MSVRHLLLFFFPTLIPESMLAAVRYDTMQMQIPRLMVKCRHQRIRLEKKFGVTQYMKLPGSQRQYDVLEYSGVQLLEGKGVPVKHLCLVLKIMLNLRKLTRKFWNPQKHTVFVRDRCHDVMMTACNCVLILHTMNMTMNIENSHIHSRSIYILRYRRSTSVPDSRT